MADSADDNKVSSRDKAKLRRVSLKIKHLSEELEQAAELTQEYEAQFHLTMSELRAALGVKEPDKKSPDAPKDVEAPGSVNFKTHGEPQQDNASPEDDRHDIENQSAKAPPWMKKIYKQIAMKTHPDRLCHSDMSPYEIAECQRLFSIAKQAVQDLNGSDLVYVAEVLGINAEIPAEMRISMLVTRSEKLQKELQQMYNKPSWIWAESAGKKDTRKKILAGICKILNLQIPDDEFLDKFISNLKN